MEEGGKGVIGVEVEIEEEVEEMTAKIEGNPNMSIKKQENSQIIKRSLNKECWNKKKVLFD